MKPPLARGLAMLWCALTASAAPQEVDRWSREVILQEAGGQGDYLAPIHASLLPDGSVMLIGFAQTAVQPDDICARTSSMTAILEPPALGEELPRVLQLERFREALDHPFPGYCPPDANCGFPRCVSDTYYCSGHTLLSDGSLIVVGGRRTVSAPPAFEASAGIDYSALWDPAARAWVRVPGEFAGRPSGAYVDPPHFGGTERYYPTATRLADGSILVVGGSQIVRGDPGTVINPTAEIYDPRSRTYVAFPTEGPKEIFNEDYTHSFALPRRVAGYDVWMVGEHGAPVYLDTSSGTWSAPLAQRPSDLPLGEPNHGASTLLLPIRVDEGRERYSNGSSLVAGGEVVRFAGGELVRGDTIDVFDVGAGPEGDWTYRSLLHIPRHHPSTVLLPDGRILIVCGHDPDSGGTFRARAEYVDPRDSFAVEIGALSSAQARGYHTVTLLLPDGRVLVGGGRAGGAGTSPVERASFEFLQPPYMFRARPVIEDAPATIRSGGARFAIVVRGAVSEVVLVALGSMTHSIDMNQRHVELELVSATLGGDGTWTLLVKPPPADGRAAPPGHYMLFVLARDAHRTPSIGKIVLLE